MKKFLSVVKEFFENVKWTLSDKHAGWQFKLCNIITNDYLRQCVVFSALDIKNALSVIEEHEDVSVNNYRKYIVRNLRKAHKQIFDIMNY